MSHNVGQWRKLACGCWARYVAAPDTGDKVYCSHPDHQGLQRVMGYRRKS